MSSGKKKCIQLSALILCLYCLAGCDFWNVLKHGRIVSGSTTLHEFDSDFSDSLSNPMIASGNFIDDQWELIAGYIDNIDDRDTLQFMGLPLRDGIEVKAFFCASNDCSNWSPIDSTEWYSPLPNPPVTIHEFQYTGDHIEHEVADVAILLENREALSHLIIEISGNAKYPSGAYRIYYRDPQ